MKSLFTLLPVLSLLFLFACNTKVTTDAEIMDNDTVSVDNTRTDQGKTDTVYNDTTGISPKVYENERFKEVTVEKIGDDVFLVRGKGQIFEANFNWVVEDGHEELQKGFAMTDAGAPEWGNFGFKVKAPKKDPNTTLHIVLFESSPKDGSRQFELPIPLY